MFIMTVSPDALRQAADANTEKQIQDACDQILKLVNEQLTEQINKLNQGMRTHDPHEYSITIPAAFTSSPTDKKGIERAVETLKHQGFDVKYENTFREPYNDIHSITFKA